VNHGQTETFTKYEASENEIHLELKFVRHAVKAHEVHLVIEKACLCSRSRPAGMIRGGVLGHREIQK